MRCAEGGVRGRCAAGREVSLVELVEVRLDLAQVPAADIAETVFTVFASKRHARQVRLVVRRVRPTPGSQLALLTTWDTTRSSLTGACRWPRWRPTTAVVEQTIAGLKRPDWRTCPRATSWPTPPGSRWP